MRISVWGCMTVGWPRKASVVNCREGNFVWYLPWRPARTPLPPPLQILDGGRKFWELALVLVLMKTIHLPLCKINWKWGVEDVQGVANKCSNLKASVKEVWSPLKLENCRFSGWIVMAKVIAILFISVMYMCTVIPLFGGHPVQTISVCAQDLSPGHHGEHSNQERFWLHKGSLNTTTSDFSTNPSLNH